MTSDGMSHSVDDPTGVLGASIRASASILEANMSFASVLEGAGSMPSHLKTIGEGRNALLRRELVVRHLGARSRSSTGVCPPAPVDDDNLTGDAPRNRKPVTGSRRSD